MFERGLGRLVTVDAVLAGLVEVTSQPISSVVELAARDFERTGHRHRLLGGEVVEIQFLHVGDDAAEAIDHLAGRNFTHGMNTTNRV